MAQSKTKSLPPHLSLPKVPADHPIYKTGYVVGGTYPARKQSRAATAPTSLAAQLSETIDQMMAEADDEATREVLKKFQSNLAGKKPLTLGD
jgi:hypothetical protein